jgi:hypothetical protein
MRAQHRFGAVDNANATETEANGGMTVIDGNWAWRDHRQFLLSSFKLPIVDLIVPQTDAHATVLAYIFRRRRRTEPL